MHEPISTMLAGILAPDCVTADNETLKRFSSQGVAPACVCSPANFEQAIKVVQFAGNHRIPLLPRGNGTAQNIGAPPPAEGLCLSTRSLNKLLFHEPADMVATAEGGMELGEFQRQLSARGQWLPLDCDPKATIGGLVATDRSAAHSHGYGTLRDLVIGMTVINGDGVLRKCGGRVVKNVTGYPLEKLYIGSLGTLGVIADVTFKLRPLPIARAEWRMETAKLKDGIAALRKMGALNLPLESLQLQRTGGAPALLISAAGTELELGRIERDISASAAPQAFVRMPKTAETIPACTYFESRKAGAGTVRFWCLNANLDAVMDLVAGPQTPLMLQLGSGAAEIDVSSESVRRVSEGLQKLGANFRIEDPSGRTAQPFGPARAEWPLMKRIRASLDPLGIMNPGRFI